MLCGQAVSPWPWKASQQSPQYCNDYITLPNTIPYTYSMPLQSVRGGRLRPSGHQLKVGSWNVEGLTEAKLMQLELMMEERATDLLCVHETHRAMSDVWVSMKGYLIILSGSRCTGREFAGVGFIVAPRLRTSVISFRQECKRYQL